MKKKSLGIIGILVLAGSAFGGFVVARQIADREGEAEFQEQLRLARLEGLPTSVAEYEATLPKVSPEDNAAPIYLKLARLNSDWENGLPRDHALFAAPTQEDLDRVKRALEKAEPALDLIQQAVQRPKCLFDQKTTKGRGELKSAANVLLLRGRLSAAEGDHASALADAGAILRIASHVDDQSDFLSHMVGDAIRQNGLHFMATMAVRFPDQAAYRQVLGDVVAAYKVRRLKTMLRGELVEILGVIEDYETEGSNAKGRKSTTHVASQTKANVVKALRKRWAAFDAPEASQHDLTRQAGQDLVKAFKDVPKLAEAYDGVFGFGELEIPKKDLCRRVAYQALLRALEYPTLPKAIKTDDLLSPYDKKPVTYKYEKGRILIEVSKSTSRYQPYRLEIGPRGR